ncbi:MATE family efflux transporter [Paenibacillus sp. MZ04-78.2]|uniref:MATE family efflux transporter n=1 Tax=Paenibacillus sp. MZ04-78.2 TaxID=2962034 RepID=UPI0020B7E5A9|nr:MATE family efflux transporter [Paenibacillus sp. MZ04-78.2]MCP3773398.1 MATE family efflux transporter [Paenibacillus sp. MZ04-78.2]
MNDDKKFTLWVLAWPIFIEMFLQFLLGTADTLMVSRISDGAVAVVGISTQLFSAVTILFMTVANGAGVLIAQKLGARKPEDARTVAIMSINISVVIGALLSLVLYLFARDIAALLQVPAALLPMADTYISIIGGGMTLTAAMAAFSTAIRNTGNTRSPMYIAIGMNVIHVVLNYAFIYGALGFPQWGLAGVAVSTLVSRLLATIVLAFLFVHSFERRVGWKDFLQFDRPLFRETMQIGWPMGVSSASWVFSQLILFSFIAMLGAKELAARTYMNTMESFCFTLGFSIAMALQIQIAHLFGAGRTQEAYRAAYRGMWTGLAVVMTNALLLYVFGSKALSLFTVDAEIVALGVALLGLNLLLQPGKMINMAIGNALTGIGDTRFIMITGVISLWLLATPISYYLGIRLGWGLTGIYISMIADEYLRGFLVLRRWKSGKMLHPSAASPGRQTISAQS